MSFGKLNGDLILEGGGQRENKMISSQGGARASPPSAPQWSRPQPGGAGTRAEGGRVLLCEWRERRVTENKLYQEYFRAQTCFTISWKVRRRRQARSDPEAPRKRSKSSRKRCLLAQKRWQPFFSRRKDACRACLTVTRIILQFSLFQTYFSNNFQLQKLTWTAKKKPLHNNQT